MTTYTLGLGFTSPINSDILTVVNVILSVMNFTFDFLVNILSKMVMV